MEKAPLGTTAEYNRPNGAVRTEEGRRIESGSVGKHEWSFGKRGSGMTRKRFSGLCQNSGAEQAGPAGPCYGGPRPAG